VTPEGEQILRCAEDALRAAIRAHLGSLDTDGHHLECRDYRAADKQEYLIDGALILTVQREGDKLTLTTSEAKP
jgi:hypothetical protein